MDVFSLLLMHLSSSMDPLTCQISIELSWEEVKPEIKKYFDFKEEDQRIEFGNWFVQEEFLWIQNFPRIWSSRPTNSSASVVAPLV